MQTSRQLHDAALGSFTFSNLPSIRLSCIRDLVAPRYQGPCLHPDCNCLVMRASLTSYAIWLCKKWHDPDEMLVSIRILFVSGAYT